MSKKWKKLYNLSKMDLTIDFLLEIIIKKWKEQASLQARTILPK